MDTYEVLSLLFLSWSFLIALLACIDRTNKRKSSRETSLPTRPRGLRSASAEKFFLQPCAYK